MLSPRAVLSAAVLLWLAMAPAAFADNTTPQPIATAPAVIAPTPVVAAPTVAPPVASESTPPPAAQPTAAVSGDNPVVSRDTGAEQQVTQAPALEASPVPTQAQVSESSAPPQATPTAVGQAGALQKVNGTPGITLPPGSTSTQSSNSTDSIANSVLTMSIAPVSAAAPAQLQCTGKDRPVAAPFLSSPFAGWAEINSFIDHDLPDYSVDGKIVLANGITALASNGQESDFFPAYWAPAIRQYVNYDGHNGYDFGISYQPVLAAAAGTVEYAGWNSPDQSAGYGQMILINHHNGYVTLYGHLSQLQVKTGDKVAAGQQIGISGTTGNSSGPHLHFSVFHNCQVTDPYGWTGSGPDPLKSFDGETSAYLWLPGRDPLILNPPPHWPAFPSGMRLALSNRAGADVGLHRSLPPADRLLLLGLPLSDRRHALSPSVAMARTQADISQEEETIAPYLSDLEAEGLLDSYQTIPSAGAVWVRGSATAAQLESLPGVASLSGVQTADVRNAQNGLSHAVVAQSASQQAPSLWPVGFRSALHASRPVSTVICGQPFVTGVALPGQTVQVILWRRGVIAGRGTVTADPTSGAFVALLASGKGLATPRAGDIAEVTTSGRSMKIPVMPISIRPRPRGLSGTAPAGSSVEVSVLDESGTEVWKALALAGSNGRYAVHPPELLPAGTLGVASIVDPAGDQVATSSFVPGFMIRVGSSEVRGWTVGKRPSFWLRRNGRVMYSTRIHPAPDGSFQLSMDSEGVPVVALAGDTASLGSLRHHHAAKLLAAAAGVGAVLAGPAGTGITSPVKWYLGTESRIGHTQVDLHGDIIQAGLSQRFGIVVGSSHVTAHLEAGSHARVRVYGATGRLTAVAVAAANGAGRLSTSVRDWLGRPVTIRPGMTVSLISDLGTSDVTVPHMQLSAELARGVVSVQGPGAAPVTLAFASTDGTKRERFRMPAAGTARASLPNGVEVARVTALVASVHLTAGVTIERKLTFPGVTARR